MLAVFCLTSTVHSNIVKFQTHFHKILYIDPNFSEEEYVYISMAANEWEEKTQHIASFTIVRLPQKQIDFKNGILILKVNEYDPVILFLDKYKKVDHEGFYDDDSLVKNIRLVSVRLSKKNYKQTVLHELGHALGLAHNRGIDGIGTLMFPALNYGSPTITQDDLINFCKIYHCNADKLSAE